MAAASTEPLVVRALRRESVERTPVWMMRQAGRYLPEYRAVREKVDFLTLCHTPELAAKVTLDAVEILDVDAAILFSDILIPVEAMGVEVEFDESGPRILNPVRTGADVERLNIPDPADQLGFVAETIRLVRAALGPDRALLGFAGAPFTVASYIVEGGSTRDFVRTKSMMLNEPRRFHELLESIGWATVVCLKAQFEAGAHAVQLFDSWGGILAPDDYHEFALRHAATVLNAMKEAGIPTILYVNGGGGLLEQMATTAADCISVDWRVELGEAWRRIGHDRAIQGNLDPIALFGPEESIAWKVHVILDQAAGRPGHVFNLGHGIHKATPVENVHAMIRAVRTYRATR